MRDQPIDLGTLRLVAANLAAALRDQPAVGEVIAWAAVASAVEDGAVEAAEEAEVDADKTKFDSSIESVANVFADVTFSRSL